MGDTAMKLEAGPVEGALVNVDGERFYRVSNYDVMPPFLMSLVSDSDHWLFIASNGALTAGRLSPDHALFPYTTDDRIYDSQEFTGSKTLLRVTRKGTTSLWEPFSQRYEGMYRVSRNLCKSVFGNKIIFEEVNEDLGLAFSYAWLTSERFGFVRRAALVNQSNEPLSVELLDGVQNLLPHGIEYRFQLEFSTLADGYKSADLEPETGLALFRMSAIPTDRAEPSEALRTTTVWSHGLEPATRLLSAVQVDRFRHGHALEQETEVRGRRGAYFLNASLELHGGERKTWYVVAEVDQDAADVAAVLELLREGRDLQPTIEEDVERGTCNLVRIVASADGLQASEDELSQWRHFSNALFNVMRGGIPDRGYWISRSDLASYIGRTNRDVAGRQAMFLHSLPETMSHAELIAQVNERDDADLVRLVSEYLPLTFSRRHGDPSRPWNFFSIEIKDERGEKILNYQGNWRDIFKNWEALALSFPGYVESMVFKFLDASTVDGNNPYRISRHGFDWDRPDPSDLWGAYGYWGDHQVIYLLKLLEVSERYHPGVLRNLLTRPVRLRGRSLSDQVLRGASRGSPQDDRLRLRARAPNRREHRPAGPGCEGRFRRQRWHLARQPDREAPGRRAHKADELHSRSRHLDEHSTAGVERCQQRPRGLRRLDGDALLPATLPRLLQEPVHAAGWENRRGLRRAGRALRCGAGGARAAQWLACRADLGSRSQARTGRARRSW